MISWILIVVAVIVVAMILFGDGEARLCPSCGTQLGEEIGRPGEPATFCTRCGWHQQ